VREVTLAATQMACDWDREKNLANAIDLVRESAGRGAKIVQIQELFETPYFCADQKEELFSLAHPVEDHPILERMSNLAAELEVVLPVSFFERANGAYFNALAIIDADGSHLGTYRKSHIPDGPGYQEKYYFNPGNTGFLAWKTRYATIGVAICWDQWFPEAARTMCLKGAEVLLYPTAIGNELHGKTEDLGASGDSMRSWQRVMQGHAAANVVAVVASNRIGTETSDSGRLTFYGSSFIADQRGELIAEASRDQSEVVTATVDLDRMRANRASWGLFRDRRPDLYRDLLTLDGKTLPP
jgi:N-carbamoylputrescine amidase